MLNEVITAAMLAVLLGLFLKLSVCVRIVVINALLQAAQRCRECRQQDVLQDGPLSSHDEVLIKVNGSLNYAVRPTETAVDVVANPSKRLWLSVKELENVPSKPRVHVDRLNQACKLTSQTAKKSKR